MKRTMFFQSLRKKIEHIEENDYIRYIIIRTVKYDKTIVLTYNFYVLKLISYII